MKEFYSRVLANGDIYRADYEGLYCVNCEEYKVVFAWGVVMVDVATIEVSSFFFLLINF